AKLGPPSDSVMRGCGSGCGVDWVSSRLPRCDLASRTELELPQDVLDVPLGCALADDKLLGDLPYWRGPPRPARRPRALVWSAALVVHVSAASPSRASRLGSRDRGQSPSV